MVDNTHSSLVLTATTPADVFRSKLAALHATRTARAYIEGVFTQQLATASRRCIDFSQESIVLKYSEVRTKRYDFEQSQQLADWVLWALSFFPASVQDHREVVETLGRLSYYHCYRIVPSWTVFDELADELPSITRQLHNSLR